MTWFAMVFKATPPKSCCACATAAFRMVESAAFVTTVVGRLTVYTPSFPMRLLFVCGSNRSCPLEHWLYKDLRLSTSPLAPKISSANCASVAVVSLSEATTRRTRTVLTTAACRLRFQKLSAGSRIFPLFPLLLLPPRRRPT